MKIFKQWLCQSYQDDVPKEIIKIFGSENIPERWIIQATKIVHRLSEMPWYTQEQLLKETSLTKAELITLNSFIRYSDFLQ